MRKDHRSVNNGGVNQLEHKMGQTMVSEMTGCQVGFCLFAVVLLFVCLCVCV